MNNWKKLVTTLATTLILILLLAACSDQTSKDKEGNDSSKGTSDSGGKSEEPAKFSIMTALLIPEAPDDKIEKVLEEKTNTELEIQWVPGEAYGERLNAAFASGTLPEVVFLGNTAMFYQYRDTMRDEQFWELGPYLDEFENLSKLKDQIIDNTKVDGKVYTIYQGRPLSRQGIIYRKDWADKLGLDAPTNTDEFYEMARAFTEDDPDGNGKDDTFGITDRNDLIYGAFKTVSSWFGTPNNFGIKDGEILPEFMFPEYKETLNFFKKLHSNGYINQDFPITSKQDQQNFFKNGTAGIYVGSMGDVASLYRDAMTLNPDAVFDVHNYVESPDGEFGIWSIPGFGSAYAIPKSSVETEEELKQILAFFDKLMTPEIADLIMWGVEGEHYTLTEEGVVPIKDQAKIDREVSPYIRLEIGEAETSGRHEAVMEFEVAEKANELIKDNEKYLINDPTVTLDSETFVRDSQRLQQIITDATYQYIIGQMDEKGFDKAVEKWLSSGGQNVLDEFNESYKSNK